MASPKTLTLIPQRSEDRMLEVASGPDGSVHLRNLAWGNGVGWYVQTSAQIECEALPELLRALRAAGSAAASSSGVEAGSVSGRGRSAKVVPLFSHRSARRPRLAGRRAARS